MEAQGKQWVFSLMFSPFKSFLHKHLSVYNAPGEERENDENINIPGLEG